MVKLIFLCRRRADIGHARYSELLLDGHVPLALRHHPTLRRYVVNIVEGSPVGAAELDSIGELSFVELADFQQRLYDSDEGEAAIAGDVRGFMGSADAYVTTEHVQKDASIPAALGGLSPGVKMICPIVRRAEMSHDAFVDHWLHRHVALALRHHPGLSKYVTNVVDASLTPSAAPLDGIAELHFPSQDAMRSGMFDSPQGEGVIRQDITRFIGHTTAYIAAEYVQRV